MKYKIAKRGVEVTLSDNFDLKNTFDCGQCFRWNEDPDGSYGGIVKGRECRIYKENEKIIIENCNEYDFLNIWKDYFDFENDYNKIRSEITEACPPLECAVNSIDGIRILNQEPWEALCSFIISQNNNIPRIKGIISRLCENFGEKCGIGYSFPSAETIACLNVDELSPLRAGFRARYIIDAAQKVSKGQIDLEKMRNAPLDECRKSLMQITGVGAKVADCTLLYGLHRLEAFPIDVWMKKALATLFSDVDPKQIGKYAGIAQQYIFHYSRLNPEKVEN